MPPATYLIPAFLGRGTAYPKPRGRLQTDAGSPRRSPGWAGRRWSPPGSGVPAAAGPRSPSQGGTLHGHAAPLNLLSRVPADPGRRCRHRGGAEGRSLSLPSKASVATRLPDRGTHPPRSHRHPGGSACGRRRRRQLPARGTSRRALGGRRCRRAPAGCAASRAPGDDRRPCGLSAGEPRAPAGALRRGAARRAAGARGRQHLGRTAAEQSAPAPVNPPSGSRTAAQLPR